MAPAPVTVPGNPVSKTERPQTNLPMPPTKPMRDMMWTGQDGKSATLADFKGKAVILDFWATYCPPCRDEIPHLNELQAKYGTDQLQVIGLNVGGTEDPPATIAEFTKKIKFTYPIAFPEDALSAFIFSETDSIPQTAVFDRNGLLVKKIVGFDASVKPELEAAIQTALSRPAAD